MRRSCVLRVLAGTILTVCAAGPTSAAVIYQVSATGQGVVEAENWSNKVDDTTGADAFAWVALTSPVAGDFANASGGKFIQALPDVPLADSHSRNTPPYVEYYFRIPNDPSAHGTYRLYIRGTGGDTAADSVYSKLYPLGNLANELAFSNLVGIGSSGNWQAGNWIIGSSDTPSLTAGDYVVRVGMRESGAGVDKIAFQLTSLAAPAGAGPASSPAVPEPASLAVVATAGALVLGRRRVSPA